MKVLIVIAILFAIGLIVLVYKRERNLPKMLLSSALLGGIIATAILGNVMRSIMPLFLLHMVALLGAYGALILYIIAQKRYWLVWIAPFLTLLLYLLLAWLENEHLFIST